MQVTLTPELERMVGEKVDSGLYENHSEVIREALRFLFERESAWDRLRHEAELGFEQLDNGDTIEPTREEFLEQMRERHG